EKPMSGSEIMSEIEKQTNGHWKPSPGSIYPLLAWLQDKGYIKEITEQEPGIRRYTLTEQGKGFLEEQIKAREELGKRFEHFRPTQGLGGPMWFGFDRKNATELRKASKDFAIAIRNLYHEMRREYSETVAEEVKKTLEEATRKVLDITKKLQE
nr:PadR family transcriptional regulator [Candidatus Njordarchaeum guaymaensis]